MQFRKKLWTKWKSDTFKKTTEKAQKNSTSVHEVEDGNVPHVSEDPTIEQWYEFVAKETGVTYPVYVDPTVTISGKKRTANDVHREIKEYYEAGYEKSALEVLKQAIKDGYKGKRMDKWKSVLIPKKDSKKRGRKKKASKKKKEK